MSRRANPYDNAMAENFFSILKTECIYCHKPASFCEANEMINRYIYFYNHERIHLKLYISLHRGLFVLSAQIGPVQSTVRGFCVCKVSVLMKRMKLLEIKWLLFTKKWNIYYVVILFLF